MAAPADAVVDADAREPRGRPLHPRHRLPRPPGLEQRLLNRILSLALVSEDRQRERVEPPGVRNRNGLEGRVRAALRPPISTLAAAITPFPTRLEAVLLTRRTYTGPQAHAPSPGSFSPHPCHRPGRRDSSRVSSARRPMPSLRPSKAPAPIVVTVDPGAGGQPTTAHPNTPFDPGAIGDNGLLEKDVDLDVGRRLAALLRADLVDVVMTRSTDVYVSAATAPENLDQRITRRSWSASMPPRRPTRPLMRRW